MSSRLKNGNSLFEESKMTKAQQAEVERLVHQKKMPRPQAVQKVRKESKD